MTSECRYGGTDVIEVLTYSEQLDISHPQTYSLFLKSFGTFEKLTPPGPKVISNQIEYINNDVITRKSTASFT